MQEVRRQADNELCGGVESRPDGWHALAVFGVSLSVHPTRQAALDAVLQTGLASLMERWTLTDCATGDEQIVCIQEAGPHGVTLALGYYSMRRVPTLRLDRADIDAQRWSLHPGH